MIRRDQQFRAGPAGPPLETIPGKAGPYPWSSLDHVSRAEVEALWAARRWAKSRLDLAGLGNAAGALVGTSVAIRLRRVGLAVETSTLDGAIAVVVTDLGPDRGGAALVEIEGALAMSLVARALRRPAPILAKPSAIAESTAGAVAAIFAATARRAHADTAIQVRPASAARSLEGELRLPAADAVVLTFTVLLGDEAFAARATLPRRTLHGVRGDTPWSAPALAALGTTPLSIPIVACAVTMTVADVAAIGPGDVLPLQGWRLGRAASGPAGRVLLASPDGEVGIRADLVDGARLVLRGERESLLLAEGTMGDEGARNALVEAIGEVPVVVRVEIGDAAMSAREWASLLPGDVVGLGRRTGGLVVLRIGGVPVARGELVDVDGEVGVRVVERLAEETSHG